MNFIETYQIKTTEITETQMKTMEVLIFYTKKKKYICYIHPKN